MAERGRPTTYKPEYDDHVRDMMGQGYSQTAAAGSLGVSRQRFSDWANANPSFRDAINDGKAGRVFKLEQDLLSAETGPQVTSRIFALKNADREEWGDIKPEDSTAQNAMKIDIHVRDAVGDVRVTKSE